MLNHNDLKQSLVNYCINELGYDKECYVNYSHDESGFKFVMGEFMKAPVLPKDALLVGISEKGASISKVINFTKHNREIICFLNYTDKETNISNEDVSSLMESIKNSIRKTSLVLESESQVIESSKDAIEEIFTDQKKVGIPLLNINITDDDSPSISYTVVPNA